MLRVEGMKLINGREVDLTVEKGEILFLQGANGTGKSLLLKSLAKLIPATWQSYEGGISNLQEHRAELLYLPPSIVFGADMTVREFLDAPLSFDVYKNFSPTFFPKNYVPEILDKKLNILSSGQRQFVALLRAMSLKAKFLLLDEPFAHIDQVKRLELVALLSDWAQERSIIMVNHDEVSFPRLRQKYLILS